MNSKIKLVAIIGEAGSGKDTLLNALLNEDKEDKYHRIVSYTTRRPRANEINGKDYFFINSEEFTDLILQDKILEATVFNDWVYGTGLESIDKDKINIGVFNPEGIETLSEMDNIDLLVIRCMCPDKDRLLRQLYREPDPDVDEIVRRYLTDKSDFNSYRVPQHVKWFYMDTTTAALVNAQHLTRKIDTWAEKDNDLI